MITATIYLTGKWADVQPYTIGALTGTIVVFTFFWLRGWRSPRSIERRSHTVPLIIETYDEPEGASHGG